MWLDAKQGGDNEILLRDMGNPSPPPSSSQKIKISFHGHKQTSKTEAR
jgi:hypothetical protein